MRIRVSDSVTECLVAFINFILLYYNFFDPADNSTRIQITIIIIIMERGEGTIKYI